MMYSENDSPIYIAAVLGQRLKRIRLNLDMTQEEVASKAWVRPVQPMRCLTCG